MRGSLGWTLKNLLEPKAVVLMYHRIAEPASDVWETAVSPAHFEQQLKVLQKRGNVVSLPELADQIRGGKISQNSIAITFDDGYRDNFLVAKPLLERYQLPATFFITAGLIGQDQEFWWDELEHLILFTEQLPPTLSLDLGEAPLVFALTREAVLRAELLRKHQHWQAMQAPPPTLRCKLFLQLYTLLKPLAYEQQQQKLTELKKWANGQPQSREAYRPMSRNDLQELPKNGLFTIGSHTMTHPALGYHSASFQYRELHAGKTLLKDLLGVAADLLAYPYGNYDGKTISSAAAAQFKAAFTTSGRTATRHSPPYQIGRVQVGNWAGQTFERNLNQWLHFI